MVSIYRNIKIPYNIAGDTMKTFVILVVLAAVMFIVTGCGPGQPFQIEDCYKASIHYDIDR